MSAPSGGPSLRATIHLVQQATVAFAATRLWPATDDTDDANLSGGTDGSGGSGALDDFAAEVTRRLRVDGYVGFRATDDTITVVPLGAVKRIDFAVDSP